MTDDSGGSGGRGGRDRRGMAARMLAGARHDDTAPQHGRVLSAG